uniref:Uncharacterized protein n=1 Tax=Eutreptiella gymnastica TaxID=73025 RepID=A0A6T2BJP4_9EUGL
MRKCPNLCQSAKGWGWRASALWWCAQGVGKPSSSPALEWKGVGKPSLRPVLVCKGCPSLKRMPAFVTSTNHIRSDHCYNQSSHATSSMGLKGRALLWLMWITSSKRSALSLTCRTYATFMSSIIFLVDTSLPKMQCAPAFWYLAMTCAEAFPEHMQIRPLKCFEAKKQI